jgi:hypothetical protein
MLKGGVAVVGVEVLCDAMLDEEAEQGWEG